MSKQVRHIKSYQIKQERGNILGFIILDKGRKRDRTLAALKKKPISFYMFVSSVLTYAPTI